jgi:tetratricopeptide (TPR) repeat protein
LRTTAIQLRIVSLSGQDRVADARLLVQDLSEHDVSAILSVLDGLMQLADDADEQMKTELASLQLKAAESLASRRKELTDDQQLRLDRCLGQAYASTHQPRKAIEAYERLSVAHPRDLDVLRTLSQLLVECNTAECLAKARDNWRKIESLEKAGSSGWLEARYNVARCLFLLKQYAECGKLLAVTRLLYPNLGSEELKSKYAQLELENKKSSGD